MVGEHLSNSQSVPCWSVCTPAKKRPNGGWSKEEPAHLVLAIMLSL